MNLNELFLRPTNILQEGIEHLEDTVFANGSAGAQRAANSIAGLQKDPGTVTIKWDGFPAVVFGRDKNGNLVFVDKHQFDKVAKGKEEFSTIRDYDERRGANRSNLWSKEEAIRPTLDKVVPAVRDTYWMGDLMWTGTPPNKDGYFVFKPNTVEYRVKIDDTPGKGNNLGDKIARSIAGIAVHTFIPGLDSGDQPLVGLKGLNDEGGIVFLVGEMKNKPKILLDPKVKSFTDNIIKQYGPALDKFLTDVKTIKASTVTTAASPFITSMLEDNDIATDLVPRFLEFLKDRLSATGREKLLGANQDGWLYQEDGGGPGLLAMWTIWASLVDLKLHVKSQIDGQQEGSEVIAITDGETAHEGYVFGSGKDKIKLVDRLGFTRANFARHKPDPEDVARKQSMPKAVFSFGRMNPPTLGHAKVLEKTVQLGGKNGYIFLSNSHKAPDDPLDPATKKAFIRAMYPQYANNIVDDPVQNALFAANWLYDKGFRNMTFIGGSDRLGKRTGSIEKLLNNWNSGPIRSTDNARGPEGREYVHLEFVSSGERDADSPGIEGYSGTKARKAAEEGNEQLFNQYTGVKPNFAVNGMTLYQAVRKGLGIADQPEPTAPPIAQKSLPVKGTTMKSRVKQPATMQESTSLKTTVNAIANDIGEPIKTTFETLKTMAQRFYDKNGTLKGFAIVAGGVGGRWVQKFYVGRLQNELYDLVKQHPQSTTDLKEFLGGRLVKGELELPNSFGALSGSLPFILSKIGRRIGAANLERNANAWIKNMQEYEEFKWQLETDDSEEDNYDQPKKQSAKDTKQTVAKQSDQAEKIVSMVLSKLPQRVSGEIRNSISRSSNKLQALQAELQKRGIKAPMLEKFMDPKLFTGSDKNKIGVAGQARKQKAPLTGLLVGEQDIAESGKIKGVDGKACWKGKRYAGKVKKADGTYKDKCVPVGESWELEMSKAIKKLLENR